MHKIDCHEEALLKSSFIKLIDMTERDDDKVFFYVQLLFDVNESSL